MRYRVLLLGLSCMLFRPERTVAQHAPTIAVPPPEASQFDFLLGEWTVDVTSKAANAPPRYKGTWQARKTLNGLGIVDEYAVSDDGNQIDDDACSNQCKSNVCGDGVIRRSYEQCGHRPRQR